MKSPFPGMDPTWKLILAMYARLAAIGSAQLNQRLPKRYRARVKNRLLSKN